MQSQARSAPSPLQGPSKQKKNIDATFDRMPLDGRPSSRRPRMAGKGAALMELIRTENEALLTHRYFDLCRSGALDRGQALEIVKQLFCFSVCFERLLTLRIARHSAWMDPRTLRVAREHLREELGHVDMFRKCLRENGVSSEELARLSPKMFTTALFGYLLATVLHETDLVANVAMISVMERIGVHFFRATSVMLKRHDMQTDAVDQHAEEDEGHATMGLELLTSLERRTLMDCRRVITDLYRLMGHVLDEWLTPERQSNERLAAA